MTAAGRVGLIGLGNIGLGMAESLCRDGFRLMVYDIDDRRQQAAEQFGATAATSVGELSASCTAVLVCVRTDEEVRGLFLEPGGILEHAAPGNLLVVHSTAQPATLQELERLASGRGTFLVDAPLSGRAEGAHAGELTLMVGGSAVAVARARDVLAALASNVIQVGPVGAGQIAKLANNIMALCNQLLVMEAAKLGASYGLDRALLLTVAAASSGQSWSGDHYDHFDRYRLREPELSSEQMSVRLRKDLDYAVKCAADAGLELPILDTCRSLLPSMFLERWAASSSSH
jgi:3-hydroxyisobutyrate dehydrogenase